MWRNHENFCTRPGAWRRDGWRQSGRRPLEHAEAQQAFRGTFELEDGKLLSVSQRGRKLYAQVDGSASVELIAAGEGSFVSASGTTRLEFRQAPNGSVAGVRLIHTPS